jgi:hypothetical protein
VAHFDPAAGDDKDARRRAVRIRSGMPIGPGAARPRPSRMSRPTAVIGTHGRTGVACQTISPFSGFRRYCETVPSPT